MYSVHVKCVYSVSTDHVGYMHRSSANISNMLPCANESVVGTEASSYLK